LQKALPPRDGDTEPREDSVSGKAAELAVGALESAIARIDPKTAEKFHSVLQRVEPQAAQILANVLSSVQPAQVDEFSIGKPKDQAAENEHAKGHFEGKWFTHTLMATYSDTNSVGNIYFGQYVMWVGKVREMFFRCCMPGFDLSNTHFYILTRQIEHKFNIEAKEFDLITVRIKIGPFNRKFATLEHEILNAAGTVLGKGKQVLLFVSSKDYSIIDLPNEVKVAFLPHI
jgi:acyl-CoA thioesterase FadM